MGDKNLHRVSSTAIIHKEGRYLLVQRSFEKKSFPGEWTVPGGKLEFEDYSDLPKTTADHWYCVLDRSLRREIREEVNLEVGKLNYLLNLAFLQPDAIPSLILSFYTEYKTGEVILDEENINYAWATLEETEGYDLVEGLLEEIQMTDRILKGEDPKKVEYGKI